MTRDKSINIAERHAAVVGSGPRIAALANADVGDEEWALVRDVRRRAGASDTSEMPEYMRIIAKHGPLFRVHMEIGSAIFAGLLPARERELAVLRVGWLCQAPYEWGEHVVIAQRSGIDPEEVSRVVAGSADPGWSRHESAILKGVEELLADHELSDTTYEILRSRWSEEQFIEYLFVVGHYQMTAIVQNALRIPLAPGNGGLAHR